MRFRVCICTGYDILKEFICISMVSHRETSVFSCFSSSSNCRPRTCICTGQDVHKTPLLFVHALRQSSVLLSILIKKSFFDFAMIICSHVMKPFGLADARMR